MAWVLLMVACQAALFDQPAETAFDDPASRQHDEALLVFEFFDDAQPKAGAVAKEPAHALHEFFELTRVSAVGEDHQQAHEAVAEHAQEQLGSIAILNAGRRDHRAQQKTIGVGEHMTLATLDFFARVIAATQRRKLPAFDTLAVDDSGAGHGVFFSIRRVLVRSASLMRGHKPCCVHLAKASCTVLFGGKSLGSSDHWQPVLST